MNSPVSNLLKVALYPLLFLFVQAVIGQNNFPAEITTASITEVYKTVGETNLKAWIFNPPNHKATEQKPAIVFFFGGGWRGGTPTQFTKHCEYLAARGMVAITVDYRVFTRQQAKPYQCVEDAKSAVRWIRQNAKQLGVHPDKIVAAGGSAGGHLAASTATINKYDNPSEDASISSIPNALALFNPVLLTADLSGKYEIPERQKKQLYGRFEVEPSTLSPAHHLTADLPPSIIFHGTDDQTVPFRIAEIFHQIAKEKGNDCTLVSYEGEGHGFFNYGRKNNAAYVSTVQKLDDFLVKLGYIERITSESSGGTNSNSITGVEQIFEMDGRKRAYYLHIPASLKKNAPLVFALHGYGGTAESMIDFSKMNDVADREGFAVCYPQGHLGPDNKNSWNAGYSNDEVDDVKFLTQLAQHLQNKYTLSKENTFSTGMSNGADMSYVLACQAPDVFAAIAPVAGCMMESTKAACTNARTIPIFEIHGDQDDITLWEGDKNYSKKYGGYYGTQSIIDFWKEKNKTTHTSIDTLFDIDTGDGSYIATEKHSGGVGNKQVWLYKLVGGKHDWPGTWGNKDIQTSEVVWEFFKQFLKEEPPSYPPVETTFSTSTPEAEGISSQGILSFIERAEKEIDALHSYMIIRNGKKVAEGWWTPYHRETPHVMHSLSKSFTSTAIGMLVDEGKLALNDKVLSFFPEYAPENPSWQWQQLRIRDLLTMNTGHIDEPTVWFSGGNWAALFMKTEIPLAPGTHFKYNSPATYMLSAILQKVTGEQLVDYLTPRLFKPLQIKKPHWDVCPKGINTGGWGLSITTEDIAKLGQLYLQKGVWNGQQLLSKEWASMATSKQVSNGSNPENDWNQGYGFQFWQCRHNAFRGDGAMGQFCIVVPEKDLVIAITSGTYDMGKVMNVLWEELLPAVQKQPLPAAPKVEAALKEKSTSLQLAPIIGKQSTSIAKKISKKSYILSSNPLGIQSIDFNLHKLPHSLAIKGANGTETVRIGTNQHQKGTLQTHLPYTENLHKNIAASGAWIGDKEYQVQIYLYDMPERITYTFQFEEDQLLWDSKLEHSLLGAAKQEQLTGKR